VLEEVGEPWKEEVVTLKDWMTNAPSTSFHRLPVYTEGRRSVHETFAILNYLGRKHSLLGGNVEESNRCDTTVEAWRDHNQRFTTALSSGSKPTYKHFFEQQQPQLLGDLEAWYGGRELRSEFWAGSLTIADFVAFNSIDELIQRYPTLLDGYEQLLRFYNHFAARPTVRGWLASTKRQPALSYLGPDGKKLYPTGA